jgi:hypothetical protein
MESIDDKIIAKVKNAVEVMYFYLRILQLMEKPNP